MGKSVIPASLITRATLNGVAQTYRMGGLPTDPDTCVLWDCLQVYGCEKLPPFESKDQENTLLHRWVVLDAIESAESVPQDEKGKAVIRAARAWVAEPCERLQKEAYASTAPYVVGQRPYAFAAASMAAHATGNAPGNLNAFSYAVSAASNAAYAATNSKDAAADAAFDAANTAAMRRFQVLKAMAAAGVLPEPSS